MCVPEYRHSTHTLICASVKTVDAGVWIDGTCAGISSAAELGEPHHLEEDEVQASFWFPAHAFASTCFPSSARSCLVEAGPHGNDQNNCVATRIHYHRQGGFPGLFLMKSQDDSFAAVGYGSGIGRTQPKTTV